MNEADAIDFLSELSDFLKEEGNDALPDQLMRFHSYFEHLLDDRETMYKIEDVISKGRY